MKQTVDHDIVTIQVGKNGLTTTVVEEIKLILKKRRYVRVKFLKSFMDNAKEERSKKEIYRELAENTKSRIEKSVGFVVILRK